VNKYKSYQVMHGWLRSTQDTTSPQSLRQFISQLSETERWSIEILKSCSDEGRYIAASICEGLAIAISNSSYKEGKGGFAWLFEDKSERNRLVGCNRVPGAEADQSAHRSELVGLLGIVTMVGALCNYHSISEGQILVGCDNISALKVAFEENSELSMIFAIRHAVGKSNIKWDMHHVRGHQDSTKTVQQLSRYKKLNCEMDELAKSVIIQECQIPVNKMAGEPWSICTDKGKIIKHFQARIYFTIYIE
jgi:hypothetical protein